MARPYAPQRWLRRDLTASRVVPEATVLIRVMPALARRGRRVDRGRFVCVRAFIVIDRARAIIGRAIVARSVVGIGCSCADQSASRKANAHTAPAMMPTRLARGRGSN